MPIWFRCFHENRILAHHGLECLSKTKNPGLQALLDVCGVDRKQALKPSDISFRIGPRINASGRLADATVPVHMLLNDNYSKCVETAKELESLNVETTRN